ncbi:MAG: hypothetical protein N3D71_12800, partial [Burkholderiaceae bacterium]|nr:hypothetical protein [Burkholderiaceae bacterium]
MKVREAAEGADAPHKSPRGALTSHDVYLLREGTHARLYGKLGCQLQENGAHFGVWAPNAERV